MPSASLAPSGVAWVPREKDLKRYLHFDRWLPREELIRIANSPIEVARNPFFPFLRYTEEWQRFAPPGQSGKLKKRPIRYASRRDAAIYARYRADLSVRYEAELQRRMLHQIPTAYRRVPIGGVRSGNKCNIEFARDAFDSIRKIGDCYVTVVDISSFFESMDHALIRSQWESLLQRQLPIDHEAVFRAITQYAVVDLAPLQKRLGLNKLVEDPKSGKRLSRARLKRQSGHVQMCSTNTFRRKVVGEDSRFSSLIQKNRRPYGIPQGSPISDLIANFYLIDFDQALKDFVEERGGFARRYSDDIIVVLPSDDGDPFEAQYFLQKEIRNYGDRLRIKAQKVAVMQFARVGDALEFYHLYGKASRNGLEYLGFRFDGKRVFLKDSSLSHGWRKLQRRANGAVCAYIKQFKLQSPDMLRKRFPSKRFLNKLLRVPTSEQDRSYEDWTFNSYTRRAANAFSQYECRITDQTRRYRYRAERRLLSILERELRKLS